MKYLKYILFIGLFTSIFSSCYDDKMEWIDRESDLTVADLPLPLQEKIARYGALKTYLEGQFSAGFKFGVGINLDEFVSDSEIFDLVNENFNDITIGYDMKHGPVMGADGKIKTANLDRFFKKLKGTGMSLYGHTLVWHSNQNASYLNSLIAPTIIPPAAGGNLLDLSGLQDASFNGWNPANNAGGISIVEGAGIDGGPAIRFDVTSAGDEWDTQLLTPDILVTEGNPHVFSFKIRSEEPGSFRVSYQGMSDNYPWYSGAAMVSTTSEWTGISYGADGAFTAAASSVSAAFDMGKTAGVYYVDINSMQFIDLNATDESNYVTNGGFETGDLTNWSAPNPGDGIEVVNTEKYEGSSAIQMKASATSKDAWDLQLQNSNEILLEEGKKYTFSFMIKSDQAGKGRVSFPGYSDEYPWMDWQGKGASESFSLTGGTWEYISTELTGAEGGSSIKLSFDLGYLSGVTYWIDDIKIVPNEASETRSLRAGPTIIEKTPEEKKELISAAMKSWIFDMVGYCKEYVYGWDVLNEPMKPGGGTNPRDASVEYTNDDEFNYPLYMGDDYSTKAFIWAREADPKALLFINEYNLESNIPRCEGYIKYINEIEKKVINEPEFAGKKAKIDGIGTQMHLTYDADNVDNIKAGIKTMLEMLAATGKLIKITELDIALGTANPTLEQQLGQADLYQYIIDSYKAIIPQAQQFGITIWGTYDTTEGNWLSNESPCIWNAKGARKAAYKGVADGVAGRDISEDFSGELIY